MHDKPGITAVPGAWAAASAGHTKLTALSGGADRFELAVHPDARFAGTVSYEPGRDGKGLSMKLGSQWGATQSGVQSLWSPVAESGEYGQSIRLGMKLSSRPNLEAGLEPGQLRTLSREPENALQLNGRVRF